MLPGPKGREEWGAVRVQDFFWRAENVLELETMVWRLHNFVNILITSKIVYFRRVNFMVCELDLKRKEKGKNIFFALPMMVKYFCEGLTSGFKFFFRFSYIFISSKYVIINQKNKHILLKL